MKIKKIKNGKTISLALEGDLDREGAYKLRRAFEIVGRRDQSLILDFQETGMIGAIGLACLEEEATKRSERGGELRAIHIPDRLKTIFTETDLAGKIQFNPFDDEANFVTREDVPLRSFNSFVLDRLNKTEVCPQCKAPLRMGAHSCLECGSLVRQRRAPRHAIALPFLYRTQISDEFMDYPWKPSITIDMDLSHFSGICFFTESSFTQNQEMQLFFPTLSTYQDIERSNRLLIFRGRVKNQGTMGKFNRVGLALFDFFEYEGSWNITATIESL